MSVTRSWFGRRTRLRRTTARAGVALAAAPRVGAVPQAVAFEAIAAQLAHERGEMTHEELVSALTAIVSDVSTQADVFDVLARVVQVASSSLESAARCIDAEPDELLRVAALEFARRH